MAQLILVTIGNRFCRFFQQEITEQAVFFLLKQQRQIGADFLHRLSGLCNHFLMQLFARAYSDMFKFAVRRNSLSNIQNTVARDLGNKDFTTIDPELCP